MFSVHGDPQGSGDFQLQNGTQDALPKRIVSTAHIRSSDNPATNITNGGIIAASTSAATERRNIYGLPHPTTAANATASTVPDGHVFAVPSSTASVRNFASDLNCRHNRSHNYHQQNFNQARNHHHHHNQVQHSAGNNHSNYQGVYNAYQKHPEVNHLYSSHGDIRSRSLSGHR